MRKYLSVLVELVGHETLDDGGLSDALVPHENDLEFDQLLHL